MGKVKKGEPKSRKVEMGFDGQNPQHVGKTAWIAKQITDDLSKPIFPYKRPMGGRKENPIFNSRNFVFDEYNDCNIT